jgi:O-antigen/teichoic acid export membrane protein
VPSWDRPYLKRALWIGLPVQASYLLLGLSARVDLLIVQLFKGLSAAGLYSVALTTGQLVFYGPVAVAVASYPVAAALPRDTVTPFVERAARTAVAVGILSAVVLVPVLPIVIPALFGPGFAGSVSAALILLAGGILQGLQWVTCRMWAAQGRGGLLALSCGVVLGTMIVVDLVLVPAYGGRGAAVGSVIATAVGTIVALAGHCRYGADARLTGFIPRGADFLRIVDMARGIVRRVAGRGASAA